MKKVWLIVLIIIASLWVVLFALSTGTAHREKPVENGVLDLRNQTIGEEPLLMTGKWEFYWNELLTPKDSLPPANYIQFPEIWNHLQLNGKPLPTMGYATYRMKILLPKGYPPLALQIPDIYCSYRLYLNDTFEISVGKPAKTKEESQPSWSERIVTLPRNTDTITVLLQVANFWHAKGGPHKTIRIGKLTTLLKQSRIDWAMNSLTTGFILMSSFLFFGLYLFARHDKAILYFALFALAYSYRILGAGPYLIFSVFQDFNWFLILRLEYLSLVISFALLFQYIRYLYPEEANTRVIKVLIIVSTVYCFIIIFFPVRIYSSVMPAYLIILFFYLAYSFYVFLRAYLNKRNGSDFSLISACIAFVLFLFLNLNYFKLAPIMNVMMCTGYIIFLFVQAIILSSRFEYTLNLSARQAQLGAIAKSEFLSTMSHEIRTPLNTIVGLSHILLKEKPAAGQKESLDLILFSANNLLVLVNDILDFNKLDEGKSRLEEIEIDLHEIVKNSVNSEQNFAKHKNILLEYEMDSRVPETVISDPTRITQLLANLLHNAIKFTEEGSVKLSVVTEMIDEYQVILTFIVKDTGIGISEEEQKIIFKRFTQADSSTSRKYGGTGLGLSICMKILNLYHSTLQLRSTPGKGSEFWFTLSLPISSNKKTLSYNDSTNTDTEKPLIGYSILLAEDNKLNAMIAQNILEGFGAQVFLSENGKDAIEKFDPAIHNLIIMDVNMPVMDGYEATRELRKRDVTIPIIALTANLASEISEKIKAAGMTDILGKPFDPITLSKTILKYKI